MYIKLVIINQFSTDLYIVFVYSNPTYKQQTLRNLSITIHYLETIYFLCMYIYDELFQCSIFNRILFDKNQSVIIFIIYLNVILSDSHSR